MTQKQLLAKVLDLIRREDFVTITELKRWMSGDILVEGDRMLALPGKKVPFDRLSPELADALDNLIRSGQIVLHSPTLFEEIGMEKPLNMPRADWSTKVPYGTPHWLPSVMSFHI